jgi:hypothetical protein
VKEHRIVGVLALALVATCLTGIVTAANGALSYVPPTTYEDNTTPLVAADVSGYVVLCTYKETGATTAGSCASLTPSLIPYGGSTGTVTFVATAKGGEACFRLVTELKNGMRATVPSNIACKPVAALSPNSPGSLTITITLALTSSTPITVVASAPVVTRQ